MSGVQNFNSTAASNTDTAYFPENQLPSTVNNAARQVMADLAAFYREDGWRELGDGSGSGTGSSSYTATYASANSVTFASADVTAIYHEGRAVRANVDGGSYIYGYVDSSSFSTNTTVNFNWFSGSLSSGTIRLWVSEHTANNPDLLAMQVKEVGVAEASSSGTLTYSVKDGNGLTSTLTENIATFAITWPAGWSSFTWIATQDGTGGWTVSWPAAFIWPESTAQQPSSGAGAVSVFTFFSPDGGTTVHAFLAGPNMG